MFLFLPIKNISIYFRVVFIFFQVKSFKFKGEKRSIANKNCLKGKREKQIKTILRLF